MERLTRIFAETTHGTKGYEAVNEIKVDTESIHNLSEIITTLGKIEDVLEEFELTSAEDLRNYLNFKGNMAIWEGKLELKNKIKDLEQKLAELKKKAIVPKFQVGQDIFVILDDVVKETSINSITIFSGNELSYYCKYVGNERMYLELYEEEIFATKEEAEQKLAEIKGVK